MDSSSHRLRILRALRAARLFAIVAFAVAAVNHGVLALAGGPTAARHAVFVGVNLVMAGLLAGFARWPTAALVVTVGLTAQQLVSHGADLVASLGDAVDWTSLGVVLFFPALVIALAVERRSRRREPPRPAPPSP